MIRTGIIFLVGLLLVGCDAHQMTAKNVRGVEVNNIKPVESNKLNDIEKMEQCRRELEALKRIDIRIYNQRKGNLTG